MKNKIWVSNQLLNWEVDGSVMSSVSKEEWKRAYEIWNYAKNLIENNDDRENLSQAIIALKRSYNQRHQLLSKIYPFDEIHFDSKVGRKRGLELLEQYNIIRPLHIKKLLSIRNDIEHNDTVPPEKEKCLELVDHVWSFLKITDQKILNIPQQVIMKNEKYFYEIDFNFENSSRNEVFFNFKGFCALKDISFCFKEKYIELQDSRIISNKNELESEELFKPHVKYNPHGIFIEGCIKYGEVQYSLLYKILNDPWSI
ncbi:hypothetical protein ACINLE_04650 [Bacillus sp. z60-18]|uniref:hypothetical protein n=1 Tax=unclassified Bacillus (in: firmicutes) TaxID=185979 RepID=UPI00390C4418